MIAMHAAGFEQTVGLCGVELTKLHIEMLAGVTARVMLLLDSDAPGQEAVTKQTALLTERGF